ncbi:MAG: hypothetical protein AUJ92_00340 [Armatimonadetes bacterium CG2_30_59_28]|nr:MAG: hypothetical protein AUJ92_00340 [Armatimonadetes bacterium CG2_30_59_28]PIU66556.1 MAG: hypothetical protein COS85_04325 [Armatimonadetes bacterium CG07_land_8_20_14_0_80_59_28]PIX42221.1 MAG: hypothetical protein COZ56_09855 [Armatimonadetes bacterium CG_4_8_14_3_um_filter_58_9]PJB64835.1 MAG: hypothetical protein CO095_14550 [Armatimonadetes bacterium CG_4_9_14_3_um_filter_58_7]
MTPGSITPGCLLAFSNAIILTRVLVGQWTAIGFVLTVKTVARFKQLEERQWAEDYLVGTLASASIAIVLGTSLLLLLK